MWFMTQTWILLSLRRGPLTTLGQQAEARTVPDTQDIWLPCYNPQSNEASYFYAPLCRWKTLPGNPLLSNPRKHSFAPIHSSFAHRDVFYIHWVCSLLYKTG